jgi:hypothetical protein
MPEENKNITTINFLVLSLALWVFTALFSIFSYIFIFIVNLVNLNGFVKNINEYVSALILAILVFGAFTGCIMLSEGIIKKFWPKLLGKQDLISFILTLIIFVISVVGMYYFLATLLVMVENKI